MFYPSTAIGAFLVRRAAAVVLVVACLGPTRAHLFGAGLLTPPPVRPQVSLRFGRPAVALSGSVRRPATTVGRPAITVAANDDQPAEAPKSVEVFGKVIDAETEKPIEAFITQAGKFDPKDPKNVTWGFTETRSSSGSFSATIRWNEGWTARILADGYVPQPILGEAPPAGKDRIETVIRLKKGRIVRGRVLDHLGKPVKDASIFAVRPMGMTLAGGRAVHSWGEEDRTVRGAKTDSEGRFELAVSVAPGQERAAGEPPASATATPGLAVSSPEIDAWPVPLPEGNAEALIRLPSPTRVEIRYDIEGSDEEASVFLQSVMHDLDAWKGFEIIRQISVPNQGRVEITSLPPGKYQFARSRTLRHGNIGQGHFLDRQFVEVVSDKTTPVTFVRTTGTRLKGSVEWDEATKLTGVILTVRKVASPDDSPGERHFPPLFDARLLRVSSNDGKQEKAEIIGHRGLFLTERIPPGTYDVHAAGYAPLTPEQERRTGRIGPTLTVQTTVTIPESGEVPLIKLKLEKPTPPAKRLGNSD
jgi:hypothetical protein